MDRLLRWWYRLMRKKHVDNATFLMDNGGYRCMNFLSLSCTYGDFCHMVNRCKAAGADTLYLYVSNQGDGSPAPTRFHDGPNFIDGRVNTAAVKEMQKRLMYALKKGMYIDLWLFADDSPVIARQPTAIKVKLAEDALRHFNDYADRWVVGLEADEHMNAAQVDAVARALKKSGKKVGLHLKPGQYSLSSNPNIDIHYHQYGFGKTAMYIQVATDDIRAKVGKPVVAAEYDLSSTNKALGDAAMRGGAIGTGNGRSR